MNEYARNVPEGYYEKLAPQKFYQDLKDHVEGLNKIFDLDPEQLTDFFLEELIEYFKILVKVVSSMSVEILGTKHKGTTIDKGMECGKHEHCGVKERLIVLVHDMMFPRISMLFSDMMQKYEIPLIASDFTDRVSMEYFGDEAHLLAYFASNHYMRLMDGYFGNTVMFFDTVKVIKYIAEAVMNSPETKLLLNFSQN